MEPEPATSQTHDFICEECFPPYSQQGKSDEPPKAACERCGGAITKGGHWYRKGADTRKKVVMEGGLFFKLEKEMPRTTNGSIWLRKDGGTWLSCAVISGPGSCFVGKRVRITIEVLDGLVDEGIPLKELGL